MDDTWQIGGLPLHPLVVHAVIVLVPLAVLALAATQFWPAVRKRLGAATPLLALAVLIAVPITVRAGEQLAAVVGPLPRVATHQAYGRTLLPWVAALFVVAAAQWWWFRRVERDPLPAAGRSPRERAVWWALAAATAVVGVGTLIMIVLIGDSGARAVWQGVLG